MADNQISSAEWKVMEILWAQPEISFSILTKQLEHSGWSTSTIKTLLRRLVDKGFVTVDKSIGNNFKYTAVIKENECKIAESESFLERVFGGSVSMMVSALAKGKKLTEEDKKAIQKIIDQMDD